MYKKQQYKTLYYSSVIYPHQAIREIYTAGGQMLLTAFTYILPFFITQKISVLLRAAICSHFPRLLCRQELPCDAALAYEMYAKHFWKNQSSPDIASSLPSFPLSSFPPGMWLWGWRWYSYPILAIISKQIYLDIWLSEDSFMVISARDKD